VRKEVLSSAVGSLQGLQLRNKRYADKKKKRRYFTIRILHFSILVTPEYFLIKTVGYVVDNLLKKFHKIKTNTALQFINE